MRLGQRPLGAHDALGDGRLRHQERARDLLGRQTAEQAQRERNARLGREHRMAGHEHEAQQVVADVVVEGGIEIRRGPISFRLELAAELLVFSLDQLGPAQPVDRAMLRSGHEPGARVVGDARDRPPLERDDKRILRKLLGNTDVAHDPREAGDEPRLLDPPDCVDRAMGIGSRHGSRLDQLRPPAQPEALPMRSLSACPDFVCSSTNSAAASLTSAGKSENSCT